MSDTPEPEDVTWGLEMPFVVCTSTGGPYDDEAFCAGFQTGEISAMLAQSPETLETQVRTGTVEQLDLIAMRWGYTLHAVRVDDSEWCAATFEKAPSS